MQKRKIPDRVKEENDLKKGQIVYGRVVSVTQKDNIIDQVCIRTSEGQNLWFDGTELRGVYPANQSGVRMAARRYMGRKIPVMVVNDDPLTFSYTAAIEEKASQVIKPAPGDVVTGIVTYITKRNAEIEYEDCIAMQMPSSEYGWALNIDLHSTDLEVGQAIKVEVKEIKENGQIIVSRRKFAENPWPRFAKRYRPNCQYLGRVKVIMDSRNALIVNIEPGFDVYCSPIPVQEIKYATEVAVELLSIDPENCRARGFVTGLALVEA